jgi:hypothetical protein
MNEYISINASHCAVCRTPPEMKVPNMVLVITSLGYFILYSKPFYEHWWKKNLLVQIHLRTVHFRMLTYLSFSCIQCLYVQGNPFHTRILREVCGSGDLWNVRTRNRRAAHCGSCPSTSEIYCVDKIYTPLSFALKGEHMTDNRISEIVLWAT